MQPFGHNTWAKIGGAVLPFLGGAGSPSNTLLPGLRSTSVPTGIFIHPDVWPQQTQAENWGLCPFWGGGAGSASNTMWPGPRPTSAPSFISMHPFGHNTPTPETRQTAQTDRKRSDSIGQTVLQMVAQKVTKNLGCIGSSALFNGLRAIFSVWNCASRLPLDLLS